MEFVARCHCGLNNFPVKVASLPLQAHSCMCTSCRTGSGLLTVLNAMLADAPFDKDNAPDTLKTYVQKPRARGYFCKTCASPVFGTFGFSNDDTKMGWCVSVGCLDFKEPGGDKRFDEVVKLNSLYFIGDTQDGGSSYWFGDFDNEEIKHRWFHTNGSPDMKLADVHEMEKKYTENEVYKTAQSETTLDGKCVCGNVTVRIKRQTGWSMNDEDKEKYATLHCACGDCRLLSGGELMSYVNVPLINTYLVTNSADEGEIEIPWPQYLTDAQRGSDEDGFGNLLVYKATDSVTRAACSKCAAKVSYQRVGVSGVCLAAGLFGANDKLGARRDDWFDWKGKTNLVFAKSCEDAGRDKLMVGRWQKGLEAWKQQQQ